MVNFPRKYSPMKVVKIILLILLGTFIIIQFFPTMKNKSDVVPATDLITSRAVPSQVATLLHNACYDCHSNNTNYPWYNKVQPLAWFLEGHIQDAKRELNFNRFETYSRKEQKDFFEDIAFLVKNDKMPLSSYQFLHAESRLSEKEKQQIVNWAEEALQDYQ